MKTIAVNIKVSDYDIYCGRGIGIKNNPLNCQINEYGWLGNPIKKGSKCDLCDFFHMENGDTLPCYETYLLKRLEDEDFKVAFLKLKGKKLGCFCKPKPCHVDVIIRILENM